MRAALTAKFGEAMARQLTGVYPSSAPAIMQTASGRRRATDRERRSGRADQRRRDPGGPRMADRRARGAATATTGCWPAARTKGGRPILANDPHLQIEFPSVWYEMHLVAAGLDVIGVTIPGRAVRRARAQRAHRVGHDGDRRRRAGPRGRARRRRQEAIDVSRRVGADRNDQGRHSGARAQRAACRSKCGRRATAPSSPTTISTGKRRRRGSRPTIVPPRSGRRIRSAGTSSGDLATAFEAINRASDWTSFTDAIGVVRRRRR